MELFILGITFYIVIIPIMEAISALIVQAIEVLKGYLVIILTKQQKTIKSKDEETINTHAIGFTLPEIEEEEEDDDYDE